MVLGKSRLARFFCLAVSASFSVPALSSEHVPGQIILKLKDSRFVSRAQTELFSALQSKLGQDALVSVIQFRTDPALQKLVLARDEDLSDALAILNADPEVKFAEPNFVYRVDGWRTGARFAAAAPAVQDGPVNDPAFGQLWGLQNTGQMDSAGSLGRPGVDVNVVPVWKQGHTGSPKVVVAVIDTGMDWAHPDLSANLYTNPGEIPNNQIDDDKNGFIDDVHGWNFVAGNNDSRDDNDHGSHVSGTIGAVGNNGIGVVGVNWNVSILPVKFLDDEGTGTSEAATEAINYATMMKVRIMNNSWGGSDMSQALQDSIDAARKAGILFVAAAGNNSWDSDQIPSYPANYSSDNIVSVAAIDNTGALASFSNYGKTSVHVAAPGVNIYSTTMDDKYQTFSGTSMATPHVSGIAALLWSVHPEFAYPEILRRLVKTSVPVPGLRTRVAGRGRVDAYNAVNDVEAANSDPAESLWKDYAFTAETPHPYLPSQAYKFPVEVPGAKYIRIHFKKIETEATYDKITIGLPSTAPSGSVTYTVMETISGTYDGGYTTDYIEGPKAEIILTTDDSVNAWGFQVDKIQVIPETPGE